MNELADELLISRGGATKLVARLEQAGYVRRFTPSHDRRATYAQLTTEGRSVLEAAAPVQLALTRKYFGDHLTPDEITEITRLATKVLRGIDASCGWLEAALECEPGLACSPAGGAVAGATAGPVPPVKA